MLKILPAADPIVAMLASERLDKSDVGLSRPSMPHWRGRSGLRCMRRSI